MSHTTLITHGCSVYNSQYQASTFCNILVVCVFEIITFYCQVIGWESLQIKNSITDRYKLITPTQQQQQKCYLQQVGVEIEEKLSFRM